MLTDIYRKASGLLQCSIARHHRITFSSGNSPAGGLKLVTSVVAALQNVTGKSTQRGSGLMNHVNMSTCLSRPAGLSSVLVLVAKKEKKIYSSTLEPRMLTLATRKRHRKPANRCP